MSHCSTFRTLIWLTGLVCLVTPTAATCKPFTIYSKIPYEHYVDNGKQINKMVPLGFLKQNGIQPIFVIYEYRLMQDKQNKNLDLDRVKKLALQTLRYPSVPVSLDVESWSRWNVDETPLRYLNLLDDFRKTNSKSPIGFYGVVPQTFYQKNSKRMDGLKELNNHYKIVADSVDFFSPSLYNYSGSDFSSWKKAAEFAISEAHRLGNKPIFPYVTPEIRGKGGTRFLSYEEMRNRLEVLKELGFDGCIIWGGSSGIAAGATFDPRQGWAKAVIDFAHDREG